MKKLLDFFNSKEVCTYEEPSEISHSDYHRCFNDFFFTHCIFSDIDLLIIAHADGTVLRVGTTTAYQMMQVS